MVHLNLSKRRCRNLECSVLMRNRVGGVKGKYLKMLKGARVASVGYTIRTLLLTYLTNKKTMHLNRRSRSKIEFGCGTITLASEFGPGILRTF